MVLTDEEIDALDTSVLGNTAFARAIEAELIAKLCAGVETPEPAYSRAAFVGRHTDTPIDHYYTADQLRTVAAAARVKALEEAAVVSFNTPSYNFGEVIAKKIRALKGTTP